jgi:Zn-dependent peptidase ImmA (M78 family)
VAPADPRLAELAATIRHCEPRSLRLSIDATAAAAGVKVREADLGSVLLAANFADTVVLNIHGGVSSARRRFSFAHEMAHVLIRRGQMPWVPRREEEWWADWFACELILPRQWLRGRRSPRQLRLFADKVADHKTVALQLAGVSAQHVWRAGNEVICGRCGDSAFFDDCACREYRLDPDLLGQLPELIGAEARPEQLSLA